MSTLTGRAPGKLFLVGEYVVLRGAPALVAAVNRFATVSLDEGEGPLEIVSLAEGARIRLRDLAPDAAPAGDVGMVLAATRTLEVATGSITVDTRAFLADGEKLGLGRSAAAITATTAVLLASRGETARPAIRMAALAANARFQDGRGSGADVAAAVQGGVVEVRRGDKDLVVAPSAIPEGLVLVVAWSGEGAHTVPLVERFQQVASCRSLSDLGTAAEAAVDAATRGDAEDFCVAIARFGALLAGVGRDLDLPIVTPALARLVDVAAGLGVAAKPSGAGAGDCAIAFARSPEEARALEEAWRAAGFEPLSLAVSPDGVRVD